MPGYAANSGYLAERRSLALAALNALPGPGVEAAIQSLAALCEAHGLGQEVRVLETWLAARAAAP
jgi:hypothetical protein